MDKAKTGTTFDMLSNNGQSPHNLSIAHLAHHRFPTLTLKNKSLITKSQELGGGEDNVPT